MRSRTGAGTVPTSPRGRGRLLGTLLVVLAVTGCGGAVPEERSAASPGSDASADGSTDGLSDASTAPAEVAVPVDLPLCEDGPPQLDPPPEEQPPADPSLTSAEPFPDVGAGGPGTTSTAGQDTIGAARAWGESAAADHFAGTWIDAEHGAAVIAFTEEVDRYAEEVRDRFGAGWWVVRGAHSVRELDALHERVVAEVDGGDGTGTPGAILGTGVRQDHQQVSVEVVGGDDEALAQLAAQFDHPAYCFTVIPPPPSYDPDGAVRTLATVPGWRADLQGAHPGGALLEIAHDRETAERAFAENVPADLAPGGQNPCEDGLHAGLDTVDLDREVIVIWSAGRSGTCPVWIEDLEVVDGAIAVTEASPEVGLCTDDHNPFRAVLAVDRDLVPSVDELPMPIDDGVSGGGEAIVYP